MPDVQHDGVSRCVKILLIFTANISAAQISSKKIMSALKYTMAASGVSGCLGPLTLRGPTVRPEHLK